MELLELLAENLVAIAGPLAAGTITYTGVLQVLFWVLCVAIFTSEDM